MIKRNTTTNITQIYINMNSFFFMSTISKIFLLMMMRGMRGREECERARGVRVPAAANFSILRAKRDMKAFSKNPSLYCVFCPIGAGTPDGSAIPHRTKVTAPFLPLPSLLWIGRYRTLDGRQISITATILTLLALDFELESLQPHTRTLVERERLESTFFWSCCFLDAEEIVSSTSLGCPQCYFVPQHVASVTFDSFHIFLIFNPLWISWPRWIQGGGSKIIFHLSIEKRKRKKKGRMLPFSLRCEMMEPAKVKNWNVFNGNEACKQPTIP